VPNDKKLIEAALAVWAIESGISWRAFTRPSWKKVLELMHCNIGLGDHMRRVVFPQLSSLMSKYLAYRLSVRCGVLHERQLIAQRPISCVIHCLVDRPQYDGLAHSAHCR